MSLELDRKPCCTYKIMQLICILGLLQTVEKTLSKWNISDTPKRGKLQKHSGMNSSSSKAAKFRRLNSFTFGTSCIYPAARYLINQCRQYEGECSHKCTKINALGGRLWEKTGRRKRAFFQNCPFDEFFMGSNKTTFVLQNRKGANEALQIKDVPNFVGSKGTVSCYSFLFSV